MRLCSPIYTEAAFLEPLLPLLPCPSVLPTPRVKLSPLRVSTSTISSSTIHGFNPISLTTIAVGGDRASHRPLLLPPKDTTKLRPHMSPTPASRPPGNLFPHPVGEQGPRLGIRRLPPQESSHDALRPLDRRLASLLRTRSPSRSSKSFGDLVLS